MASAMAAVSFEYFPCSQKEHRFVPKVSLYVPSGHALQLPPSGPVYPLLQVQLVTFMLPAPESERNSRSATAKTHNYPRLNFSGAYKAATNL